MQLQGKTAIIVGGGGGIGGGVARRFAAEGACVAVVDRDEPAAAAVVESIRQDGGEAFAWVGDAGDVMAGEAMVEATVARYGRLDIVLNAIGVPGEGPVDELADAVWEDLMHSGLRSCYASVRPAVARMPPSGGRVVTIIGRDALGQAGASGRSAVDAAVIGFTRALALEVGRLGITANAIATSYIDTPRARAADPGAAERAKKATAVRRPGTPADVAAAATFLASEESGFITGQVLMLCGGSSIGLSVF